jgi:hypothetical protein
MTWSTALVATWLEEAEAEATVDFLGAGVEAARALGIEEIVVAGGGKFRLDRVEDLQDENVVAADAKLGEFGENRVFFFEKIVEEDDAWR